MVVVAVCGGDVVVVVVDDVVEVVVDGRDGSNVVGGAFLGWDARLASRVTPARPEAGADRMASTSHSPTLTTGGSSEQVADPLIGPAHRRQH